MINRLSLTLAVSADGKVGFQWRFWLAAAVVLLGLLAIAPLAQARLSWPGVQDLSTARQSVFRPQVAVDPQGRATVVWQSFDGSNYVVRAVRIDADGAEGAVHDLSAPSADPHGYAVVPKVAVDSQGRATVIWRRFSGSTSWIQEVRIEGDGTPGEVRDLSAAGPIDYDDPEVAIDSQDRATVVWGASDGSTSRIQTMRIGADGTLGTVRSLSSAGRYAFQSQLAIDSQGRATVTWESPDGSHNRIQAVRIGADGTPGAVQDLSAAGDDAYDGQLAVDSVGRAAVVWYRSDGSHDVVQAVRIGADGSPGAVHDLSAPGQDAYENQVAIDSQGHATIVWVRSGNIQEVRVGADGTPGTVHDLSTAPQGANDPHVAIDSRDRATVVWSGVNATSRIQAIRIGADDSSGAIQDLSAASANADVPAVAIDVHDRPTVVWATGGAADTTIQSVRGVIAAPAAPVFASTSPASPASDNSPVLIGSAAAGSAVAIYPTADCSGSPAATGTADEFASPGMTVSVADHTTSTFRATATDSEGDMSGCSASTITYIERTQSTPTLSTAASPPVQAGGRIHDTANLTGGQVPGGHITFKLYGPDDDACSRPPVFTDTVAVAGNGAYSSADFTTTAVGRYRWTADYSGDPSNAAGSSSCGAPSQFVVVSRSAPPPAVLSALAVSPRSLALSGRLVNGHCQPATRAKRIGRRCQRPITLVISYRLATPARVTITVARQLFGRLNGSRCTSPTPANRNHRRCTRSVAVPGALSVHGAYGANSLSFNARINGHTLPPGSYRLTATPTARGGQASTPHTASFTLTN